MSIDSVEDLMAHVTLATRVELSTIPPYLYALYSIEDQESDAARLLASIVVEEMLHACLTANLMLALGGEPDFSTDMMPSYPSALPHHQPEITLTLQACTPEAIRDLFMVIEQPEAPGATPEDDDYHSLGQFYAALEEAVVRLAADDAIFENPQIERQLSDPTYYGPVQFDTAESGGLMAVTDVDTALAALEIIIHQGEGVSDERWADPAHRELTHYAKLSDLLEGSTELGVVLPVLDNPVATELPEHLQSVGLLADGFYTLLYATMQALFSGTDQPSMIGVLYGLMSKCLRPTAVYLARQPVDGGRTAGASFRRFDFGHEPWAEVAALADTVAVKHPALSDVADAAARLFVVADSPAPSTPVPGPIAE